MTHNLQKKVTFYCILESEEDEEYDEKKNRITSNIQLSINSKIKNHMICTN